MHAVQFSRIAPTVAGRPIDPISTFAAPECPEAPSAGANALPTRASPWAEVEEVVLNRSYPWTGSPRTVAGV